jgi:hypothetical protein
MANRFGPSAEPQLTKLPQQQLDPNVFRRGDLKSTGDGYIAFARGIADTGQAMHAREMAGIQRQGAMMGLGMKALGMVAGKAQDSMKQAENEHKGQIAYQVDPQSGEMTAVGNADGAFAGAQNLFSGGALGDSFLGGLFGGGSTGGNSASITTPAQSTKTTDAYVAPEQGKPTAAQSGVMATVYAGPAAFKTKIENDVFELGNKFQGDPQGFYAAQNEYFKGLRQQFPDGAAARVVDAGWEYSNGLFRNILGKDQERSLKTGFEDVKERVERSGQRIATLARTYDGDDVEGYIKATPAWKEYESSVNQIADTPAWNSTFSKERARTTLEDGMQTVRDQNLIGRAIATRDQEGIDAAHKKIDDATINNPNYIGGPAKAEAVRQAAYSRVAFFTEQQKHVREGFNHDANLMLTTLREETLSTFSNEKLMEFAVQARKNYAPEAAMAFESMAKVRNRTLETVRGLPAVQAFKTIMGDGPQLYLDMATGKAKLGIEDRRITQPSQSQLPSDPSQAAPSGYAWDLGKQGDKPMLFRQSDGKRFEPGSSVEGPPTHGGRREFSAASLDHYLDVTHGIENPTGNPRAVSPTGARGDFQFISSTWARYGQGDINNPADNRAAAGRLAMDNANHLSKALGRQPTEGEVYLAHQQGAAGAAALLNHPDMNAAQALATYAGVSPSRAQQAILVNGGNSHMTAGQFAEKWITRFETGKSVPSNYAGGAGFSGDAGARFVNGLPPAGGMPSMTPEWTGPNSSVAFPMEEIAANPYLLSESLRQIQADTKGQADTIKAQLPMMEHLIRTGTPPDSDMLAAAIQFSKAHPKELPDLEQQFRAISDASHKAFELQGKDANEYINTAVRKAVESPDLYSRIYAKELMEQVNGAAKLATTNPHEYALQAGLTTSKPLDYGAILNPTQFGQGANSVSVAATVFGQRRVIADAMSQNTGMPKAAVMFPPSEMKNLANMMVGMDGPTASIFLGSIGATLKRDEFQQILSNNDFGNAIVGLAHSTDPTKVTAAYSFMEKAYTNNPIAFDKEFKGEKELMARWMNDARFYGQEDAMKLRQQEVLTPFQEKVYQQNLTKAREELKTIEVGDVLSRLKLSAPPDGSPVSFLSEGKGFFGAGDTPMAPNESDFASGSVLRQAYVETVAGFMARGTPQNISEQKATEFLRAKYAKSHFNEGRVMAYAPELKYSDVASRTAFMMQANKQIEDAAQKNGIMIDGGGTFMPGMESGSFLLADTQTANEFGTPGLHPSWVVQVRDVAGQTHILYNEDGSPLRIRFNPQAENGNVTAISRDIEKNNANSHWWTR